MPVRANESRGPRMTLRIPLILIVLAATAVPANFRAFEPAVVDFTPDTSDILRNVAGYVPLGIVLAALGARAVVTAALLSTLAETVQLFTTGRYPSLIDIASNVGGAALGVLVARRWDIQVPSIRISRKTGAIALSFALALVAAAAIAVSNGITNSRGVSSPGALEAHWPFDTSVAGTTPDLSGNGLQGTLRNGPALVEGLRGAAIHLDGIDDFIDFGNPKELRLTGSTTITAWIRMEVPLRNETVIVANRDLATNRGFQFDTRVHAGSHRIGLGLAPVSGARVYRGGNTPLLPGTWYHVAGVYDAPSRTIDVYVNGQLDNGPLIEVVPSCQASPNRNTSVGYRPGTGGTEFAAEFTGAIDDLRIYSRVLTPTELLADMSGNAVTGPESSGTDERQSFRPADDVCRRSVDLGGNRMPPLAAFFGLSAAVAVAGLWQTRVNTARMGCLAVNLAATLLFLQLAAGTLPYHYAWMIPLLTMAGAAAVAASLTEADAAPADAASVSQVD